VFPKFLGRRLGRELFSFMGLRLGKEEGEAPWPFIARSYSCRNRSFAKPRKIKLYQSTQIYNILTLYTIAHNQTPYITLIKYIFA
jgi:hypothetical protein